MKIGLLFNEAAGGNARFPLIAQALNEGLAGNQLYTCEGGFGADHLGSAKVFAIPACDYMGRIGHAVKSLVSADIKLLVSVGGDGFAANCAEVLISLSASLPILGVAGGSANVGPLIGFDLGTLSRLDLDTCVERNVIALECAMGKRIIGHAFNDVVIGDTFLGSLNGHLANIGLESFLETGEKREQRPSRVITGPDFKVMKNGEIRHSHLRARQMIVASPLNNLDFYRGKAMLGALCLAPWVGRNAVLAISDRSWVDTEADPDGENFSTIEHLLFGPEDLVTIEGLADSGHIVIDGNPFLRDSEQLSLRSCPGAARALYPAVS
ncbi:MAG: hypothetical protein WCL50_02425 [Spirochaetota bacterium]